MSHNVLADFNPSLLEQPLARFLDKDSSFPSYEEAKESVVEWRFASDDMSRLEPFQAELYGYRGVWRNRGAKARQGDFQHGFDASGKLRAVINGEGLPHCHVVHQSNYTDIFGATDGGSLRRYVYNDSDHFLKSMHVMYSGHGAEVHYVWHGAQLQKTLTQGWSQRYDRSTKTWKQRELVSYHVETYLYDDAGLFQINEQTVQDDGDLSPSIRSLYVRLPKGLTRAKLAKQIEEMLMQLIPSAVAQARPSGKYYCLLLCYCEEEPSAGWPPFLLLGNESERVRIQRAGSEVKYYCWAPDELRTQPGNIELQLRNAELTGACDSHIRLMNMNYNYGSLKKVLKNVCQALQAVDWSPILDITDDFVIAAMDNTGEVEASTELKRYAPTQYLLLKQKSLI